MILFLLFLFFLFVFRVEQDFDRLQEDIVRIVEEPPKDNPIAQLPNSVIGNVPVPTQPPPNLGLPPVQDKWYYQDPQVQ